MRSLAAGIHYSMVRGEKDATRRKELLQDIKQAAALHGFVYLMPMTKDEHTVEYWFGDIRKPKDKR